MSARHQAGQATRINIDFSHRLTLDRFPDNTLESRLLDMENSVDFMGCRAKGILNTLAESFYDHEEASKNTAIDEAMYWTIQAVIREIEDMTGTVSAFRKYILESQAETDESMSRGG